MKIPMSLKIDGRSPIPIRRQLTEQLKHVIESGGVPKDQTLPSIRELAGFLAINPNTVARVIEDLKQSGYVEARRGRGVFVAAAPPVRPSPGRREGFLKDVVIRAAAVGMTADDLAVGVLSLAGVRPPAIDGAVEVLLVERSPAELDFFAGQLEAHFPIRVDKVLLGALTAITRRRTPAVRWRAAVTSFGHLREVERVLVGACSAEGAALGRLVRRVDVIVCSSSSAERVRQLAGPSLQVMIDDRALDGRAIQMLATLLVNGNGGTHERPPRRSATRPTARKK